MLTKHLISELQYILSKSLRLLRDKHFELQKAVRDPDILTILISESLSRHSVVQYNHDNSPCRFATSINRSLTSFFKMEIWNIHRNNLRYIPVNKNMDICSVVSATAILRGKESAYTEIIDRLPNIVSLLTVRNAQNLEKLYARSAFSISMPIQALLRDPKKM